MIERILPPAVVVEECFSDPAGLRPHPDEEPAVADAVPKRRQEFTTVRHCARRALARLGEPPAAILPGARGAPGWPTGVVGSMTHCDGYRGAALARAGAVGSLGVDAEPHAPLPEGVLDAVALPAERARTAALRAARPEVCWDRLLFSAKESVYKAWFPLTGRFLDFAEADIAVDPDGTFTARLLVPGPRVGGAELTAFDGRFLVDRGLVLTAVTVPASGA
ncbi:4'-phosphopantetheinyl transferase superfamily protein [Micromonospora sp. WMMA1998]|uniref:4'-phosphopantetheinyl transferase family protein n=1 Tax=Micromonospora sp. WMMA1998 TaxID=3015167 RepID=UPI00248BE928|nr:4'-phosphopantetheinyl transferase superfamily protein [Micromonospora sp. WMMA1998]WBC15819.1 4'-phosphopantetheinyl transferase superfamily protein [Micromonospora sp. WMMA1998]